MVEASGLRLCGSWGSNYEVMFSVVIPGVKRMFGAAKAKDGNDGRDGASTQSESSNRRLVSVLRTLMALGSFPLEWFGSKVPVFEPTHQVMVFRK